MMNITRKKAVQLMLAATCAWLATGCMQEEWERPEQSEDHHLRGHTVRR